jgi:predicted NBD/HSP70 family sugar kinase
MEHYAGIDVSLERSSVCVVDALGKIVKEAKISSEPAALTMITLRKKANPTTDRKSNGLRNSTLR